MMQIWQLIEKSQQPDFDSSLAHNHTPLQALLKLAAPEVKWYLPSGAPEHPDYEGVEPPNSAEATLISELRRLKIFHSDAHGNDPYPHMKPIKRENMFVDLLMMLPKSEVKLLVAIKDKQVHVAFPNLLNTTTTSKETQNA